MSDYLTLPEVAATLRDAAWRAARSQALATTP